MQWISLVEPCAWAERESGLRMGKEGEWMNEYANLFASPLLFSFCPELPTLLSLLSKFSKHKGCFLVEYLWRERRNLFKISGSISQKKVVYLDRISLPPSWEKQGMESIVVNTFRAPWREFWREDTFTGPGVSLETPWESKELKKWSTSLLF